MAEESKNPGMTRGAIGTDTQTSNLVAFSISKENPFPQAKLVDVKSQLSKEKENPYLSFVFTDGKGKQTFIHNEYMNTEPIQTKKGNEISVEDQNATQDRRIGHIYNVFFTTPEAHTKANGGKGLGAGATGKDVKELTKNFFDKIAEDFNKGKDGKPVYQTADGKPIIVWLRLTHTAIGLQFPLYPNFIDRYVQGRPTYLRPGAKDEYEPVKRNSKKNTISVSEAEGVEENDLPPGFE